MNQDLEHLKLLSIFHYVVAGLMALVACFPVIHLAIGIAFLTGNMPEPKGAAPPPKLFGIMFTLIPAIFIVTGWVMVIFVALAGRSLGQQRRYTFCLVVAGIECLFFPFGTILGVFTIVVLVRSSVSSLFEANLDSY